MVATWTVTRHAAVLATDASSHEAIDRAVAGFLGRRITQVRFERRCSEVRCENGLRLSLVPRGPELGPFDWLQNWTVFRGDSAALTRTSRARLV